MCAAVELQRKQMLNCRCETEGWVTVLMWSTVLLGCPSFSEQPWPLEGCADNCLKQSGSHFCQQNTNSFRSLSQLLTNCFLLQVFADKKLKSSAELECSHMLWEVEGILYLTFSQGWLKMWKCIRYSKIDWSSRGNFVVHIISVGYCS